MSCCLDPQGVFVVCLPFVFPLPSFVLAYNARDAHDPTPERAMPSRSPVYRRQFSSSNHTLLPVQPTALYAPSPTVPNLGPQNPDASPTARMYHFLVPSEKSTGLMATSRLAAGASDVDSPSGTHFCLPTAPGFPNGGAQRPCPESPTPPAATLSTGAGDSGTRLCAPTAPTASGVSPRGASERPQH